ncbi:MAG: hypothetical protein DRH32_03080 [Deltaproteobacteria bacterium]|nr:MAG: hypothetical protein DRH32_03080 [Deltaproteobacteria bacterium]
MLGEHITIELFGKSYTFEADENVVDACEVARLLEKEIDAIVKTGNEPFVNKKSFAMLTQAALNIANEFIGLRNVHNKFLKEVLTRSQSLIRAMDARLQ